MYIPVLVTNKQHTHYHCLSGQGKVAVDSVSGYSLYMIGVGRPRPVWTFCSRTNLIVGQQQNDEISVQTNSDMRTAVEETCQNLTYSDALNQQCQSLGTAVAMYFYQSCVSDGMGVGGLQNVAHSVLAYADFCQAALCLDDWPAASLCTSQPQYLQTTYRCQQLASSPCISGTKDSSGELV